MNVLTEKECKKALEQLEEIFLYLDTNFHKNTAWKLSEAKQVLNRLSHAYFDNPPIKAEEIEEMKKKPVWDNKEKQWYLILDVYTPLKLNQNENKNAVVIMMVNSNGSARFVGLNCEGVLEIEKFPTNQFYRRIVEE